MSNTIKISKNSVGDVFVYNNEKNGIFKGLVFKNITSSRNTDNNIVVKYDDKISFLTKSTHNNKSGGHYRFGTDVIYVSEEQIEILFLPLNEFRNNKIDKLITTK